MVLRTRCRRTLIEGGRTGFTRAGIQARLWSCFEPGMNAWAIARHERRSCVIQSSSRFGYSRVAERTGEGLWHLTCRQTPSRRGEPTDVTFEDDALANVEQVPCPKPEGQAFARPVYQGVHRSEGRVPHLLPAPRPCEGAGTSVIGKRQKRRRVYKLAHAPERLVAPRVRCDQNRVGRGFGSKHPGYACGARHRDVENALSRYRS